jgi:hypothetical protein
MAPIAEHCLVLRSYWFHAFLPIDTDHAYRPFMRSSILVCTAVAAPPPTVPGRVVDVLTGRGIPAVAITRQGQTPEQAFDTSDSDGNFSFSGSYLAFHKPGYRDVTSQLCCQREGDVRGNGFKHTYTYTMMPQAELSGVLLESGGRPAAYREILLEHVGSQREYSGAWAPEPGRLITIHSDGRFEAYIDAVDTDLFTQDEYCGKLLLQHLRLKPGEHRVVRLVIPKPPLHTVRGRVSNNVPSISGGGIDVSLDPVSRFGSGCGHYEIALPPSNTTFAINNVPPGKYLLTAKPPPVCVGGDMCSELPWNTYRNVEVADRDVRDADLTLNPNVRVSGTLHWEGTRPGPFSMPRFDLLDATGIWYHYWHGFEFQEPWEAFVFSQVQPGRYSLRASDGNNAHSVYLREVRLDGKTIPPDSTWEASDTQKNQLDLYLSSDVAHLDVFGVDENHQPLTRYVVVVFRQAQGPYSVLRQDANALDPGEYFVLVLQPDLPLFAIRRDIISRYMGRAVPISLKPGDNLKIEVVAVEAHPLAP